MREVISQHTFVLSGQRLDGSPDEEQTKVEFAFKLTATSQQAFMLQLAQEWHSGQVVQTGLFPPTPTHPASQIRDRTFGREEPELTL